jgi:hypothetical protein
VTCNEAEDICETTVNVDTVGAACSAPLFCLNGREMMCTATGLCEDPNPSGGTPCDDAPDNPCARYICNEDAATCVFMPRADGIDCDDGNACTGDNQCYDGTCVPGPELPCDDGDPCTEDPCTDDAGAFVCGVHTQITDGMPCNDNYACFGDAPVCQSGICIQSEDVCHDGLGICTVRECQEQYYGWTDCGDPISNEGMVIGCGETLSIDQSTNYVFATREYYTYNDLCPGTFTGMEAAFAVNVPSGGQVTVSITNVSPPMDIVLLDLADWCASDTCEQAGTNTLSIDALGYHMVVLEAMAELPPVSFDISVSPCP